MTQKCTSNSNISLTDSERIFWKSYVLRSFRGIDHNRVTPCKSQTVARTLFVNRTKETFRTPLENTFSRDTTKYKRKPMKIRDSLTRNDARRMQSTTFDNFSLSSLLSPLFSLSLITRSIVIRGWHVEEYPMAVILS